jgi:hypothetical protein
MNTRTAVTFIVCLALLQAACAATTAVEAGKTAVEGGKTTVYTPGGQVADQTTLQNGTVVEELHRIFDTTVVTGDGVFDHGNEGLARQSALSLAQADLAQKVQTQVRGNTVVMNNQDVRSVVETTVNALVQNYQVDSAGYDPNTSRYRVRISVKGEQLVKEIERRATR